MCGLSGEGYWDQLAMSAYGVGGWGAATYLPHVAVQDYRPLALT